jgi:hypothetical protein
VLVLVEEDLQKSGYSQGSGIHGEGQASREKSKKEGGHRDGCKCNEPIKDSRNDLYEGECHSAKHSKPGSRRFHRSLHIHGRCCRNHGVCQTRGALNDRGHGFRERHD